MVNSPLIGNEGYLESSYFIFTIQEEGRGEQDDQSIINFLKQLDIEGLEALLRLFEEGYSFDKMYMNGEEKTIDYLNELLQLLQSGELQISNVEVE